MKTQRTLTDIIFGDTQKDDQSRKTKSMEENKKTLGNNDLSEEESNKFLAEMEGDSAEIDEIKSLDHLLKNPEPGSIIMAFKDPQRRTKAHLTKFATDSLVPNLVPILFSDDIPMEMYVIFRLVLPHKKAIAVAEKIGVIAKERKMSPTDVLAKISGLDIKSRSDLKKVITKVINYHPHIGATMKSFFSKVSVVSS